MIVVGPRLAALSLRVPRAYTSIRIYILYFILFFLSHHEEEDDDGGFYLPSIPILNCISYIEAYCRYIQTCTPLLSVLSTLLQDDDDGFRVNTTRYNDNDAP